MIEHKRDYAFEILFDKSNECFKMKSKRAETNYLLSVGGAKNWTISVLTKACILWDINDPSPSDSYENMPIPIPLTTNCLTDMQIEWPIY